MRFGIDARCQFPHMVTCGDALDMNYQIHCVCFVCAIARLRIFQRMRGKISGNRQLRNCVEDIKIVLQMSQT